MPTLLQLEEVPILWAIVVTKLIVMHVVVPLIGETPPRWTIPCAVVTTPSAIGTLLAPCTDNSTAATTISTAGWAGGVTVTALWRHGGLGATTIVASIATMAHIFVLVDGLGGATCLAGTWARAA